MHSPNNNINPFTILLPWQLDFNMSCFFFFLLLGGEVLPNHSTCPSLCIHKWQRTKVGFKTNWSSLRIHAYGHTSTSVSWDTFSYHSSPRAHTLAFVAPTDLCISSSFLTSSKPMSTYSIYLYHTYFLVKRGYLTSGMRKWWENTFLYTYVFIALIDMSKNDSILWSRWSVLSPYHAAMSDLWNVKYVWHF